MLYKLFFAMSKVLRVDACQVAVGPSKDWETIFQRQIGPGSFMEKMIKALKQDAKNCRFYLDDELFLMGLSVPDTNTVKERIDSAEKKMDSLVEYIEKLIDALDKSDVAEAKSWTVKIIDNIFAKNGGAKVDGQVLPAKTETGKSETNP